MPAGAVDFYDADKVAKLPPELIGEMHKQTQSALDRFRKSGGRDFKLIGKFDHFENLPGGSEHLPALIEAGIIAAKEPNLIDTDNLMAAAEQLGVTGDYPVQVYEGAGKVDFLATIRSTKFPSQQHPAVASAAQVHRR